MKNLQPLITAFNHILANPAKWDQTIWHCGYTHCFLGWIQMLHNLPKTCTIDGVEKLTGIPSRDIYWLADSGRTLFEIRCYIVAELLHPPFFDQDGYSLLGYDRDGYDRDGFTKNGYNRNGFDRSGYNRRGYNCRGYNQDGFDQNGFNQDGFDRNGFNQSGFDRNGFDRNGFDQSGFDQDGFDWSGFDRFGYNREGLDKYGHKLQPIPTREITNVRTRIILGQHNYNPHCLPQSY